MPDRVNPKIAAIADWWAGHLTENRAAFRAALLRKLPGFTGNIRVDYDPDALLLSALEEAGVECRGSMFSARGLLPLKTTMAVRDGFVAVAVGRGGPYETIWGKGP